jgi:hypothetical protein
MRRKHRSGANGSAYLLGSFALFGVACAILRRHQEVHIVIQRIPQ